MKFFTDLNNLFLIAAIVVSGVMLILPMWRQRSGGASVSNLEATQLMNRKNALVIDVRDADEFAKGHLLNAKHIPAQELGARAADIAKDKTNPIIVTCATGVRSAKACATLIKAGYSEVKNLQGGLAAWQAAGLPIVK